MNKATIFREARASPDSSIDLVMLDVGLPDGNGASLCKLWRISYSNQAQIQQCKDQQTVFLPTDILFSSQF